MYTIIHNIYGGVNLSDKTLFVIQSLHVLVFIYICLKNIGVYLQPKLVYQTANVFFIIAQLNSMKIHLLSETLS